MTLDDLRGILARGEDVVTEYKECADKLSRTVYETVSSFSNRYGGHMIIGADDDGNVLGVNPKAVNSMKKDFIDALNNGNKFSPTLYITLEEADIDGKIVLWVHIPVASQVVRCNGRIWDRGEDGDHDITDAIIAVGELYARKSGQFTERKVFPYAREEHLRLDELMPRVRIMAETKMPGHPWKDMDNMEIMRSSGLYEDNPYSKEKGFNLAGILLFGKDKTILSCCPGYVTDCILRRVDLDRYDDRLMIRTNLIDAYSQAIQFIREYTPDPFYLEGVQRVSVRDKIARELVSNSLVHREFSTTRIARIIIEKDRIYADNWSRSTQFGKLDPATFVPEPKNPLLAHFFEIIGYADQLGSGVRNLYKYTAIYTNGGEPELIEGDTFKTIIPLPDTVTTEVSVSLSDNEKAVYDLIVQDNTCTYEQIAEKLSISKKTVAKYAKILKEKDFIQRVGSDKTGHWEIVAKTN